MTLKKQNVKDTLLTIFDGDLDNVSLNHFVEELQRCKKEYEEKGYTNIEIETSEKEWDSNPELIMVGYRPETDKEYEKRSRIFAREKKKKDEMKERQEKREKRDFTRLLKKYGDKK